MKPVSAQQGKFSNVIVCEDIRDEVGNKKSLMGVIGGDILVPEYPATIKIAVYMEYNPNDKDREKLIVEFRLLQDEKEIAKGKLEAATPIKSATFILPTGLVTFDKDASFKIVASVNGRPEEEVLSKMVIMRTAT